MAASLAGQAWVALRDLALRSACLRGSFPVSEPRPRPPRPAGIAGGPGAEGGRRAAGRAPGALGSLSSGAAPLPGPSAAAFRPSKLLFPRGGLVASRCRAEAGGGGPLLSASAELGLPLRFRRLEDVLSPAALLAGGPRSIEPGAPRGRGKGPVAALGRPGLHPPPCQKL